MPAVPDDAGMQAGCLLLNLAQLFRSLVSKQMNKPDTRLDKSQQQSDSFKPRGIKALLKHESTILIKKASANKAKIIAKIVYKYIDLIIRLFIFFLSSTIER